MTGGAEAAHGSDLPGSAAGWKAIEQLDPGFLDAYRRFADVPDRKAVLDARTRALIRLAVDANATHLHLANVPDHIRAAFDAGASPAEVMEVLECAATLGIHAMNIGVPILVEVLEELGLRSGPTPLTEYQERLKAEFAASRGYWHAFWDEMLELDPEVFEAYTDFSSVPWHTGVLEPKLKEFIYIAFDTAATHLYVKGLRLHIRNALGYGATADEVLAIMEIASTLGIAAVTEAAPLIVAERDRREGGA